MSQPAELRDAAGRAARPGRARDAQEWAAQAAVTAAVAQASQRHAEARAAYEERTSALLFTKDFNSAMEAIMRDELATDGQRFLAWLKRYAWGEYSLFAKASDGLPKYQVDAARELGIHKSRVSHLVAYYVARGHVATDGKLLYPVIAPVLGPVPNPKVGGAEFEAFVEGWRVAHSSDFQELEVARSVVKRIRKVILSDYKKYLEQSKKAATSLLEIARDGPLDAASSKPLTPFEESVANERRKKASAPPDGRRMQSEARAFLFAEIARMQKAYPDSSFSAIPIDHENPSHQNLVNLILKKLGTYEEEQLVGYIVWVAGEFKGIGPGRRSRKPGYSGGPESLGLLVNWAEDYARVSGGARAVSGSGTSNVD